MALAVIREGLGCAMSQFRRGSAFSLGHMRRASYEKIITRDKQIENGEPCIRGLPIRVSEIIKRIGAGESVEKILVERPELTVEDIKACARFAADSRLGSIYFEI